MDSGLPLLYRLPVDGNDRLTSVFDERVVYLNLSCRGTLYLQKEGKENRYLTCFILYAGDVSIYLNNYFCVTMSDSDLCRCVYYSLRRKSQVKL